jgi:hypothetical protein
VLIGGAGTDVLNGAPGDDVVIQLVGNDSARTAEADRTRSAKAVGRRWVRKHTRVTKKGKTILRVDGEKHRLPRADVKDLV